MRINPDTKDALLFITGLFGIISQGTLAAFGVAPSYPLIGLYLTISGISVGSSMLGNGRRDDEERDSGDVSSRKAPRRKARPRRKNGQSNGP